MSVCKACRGFGYARGDICWSCNGVSSTPATPDQGRETGVIHTAMAEAIRADVLRQHPEAFSEDEDLVLVIPRQSPERTVYTKLDVSALAEAALTSRPAGGEAVAAERTPFMWAYESLDDGKWKAFMHQLPRGDGSICPGVPLYRDHAAAPPPAVDAEKLRIAREALERIEFTLTDPVPGYSERIAKARPIIAEALSALNGKG